MIVLLLLILSAPNMTVTPGLTRGLTLRTICATRWGLDRRFVSEHKKRLVAAAYGIERSSIVRRGLGPCCEFDHLIPREIGGSDGKDGDDIRNIWPQSWADATVKDRRENRLHRLVCSGGVSLKDAQQEMRNWGR